MNSQVLGLCCCCRRRLEEAQRSSSTMRAPDNSMEALEWRKRSASKRFRSEDMECNAGVKMLSFSSPENKIGGGNRTPLEKQETVVDCAFQFNYMQNNKICCRSKDAAFDLPLPSISERELDWAKAANRIVDKVRVWFLTSIDRSACFLFSLSHCIAIDLQIEADEREESLVARSKRRLTLTTQLMQQILPPLPAWSLSADAIALHESIVYMAAMLALTDAWSSSCFPESISSQNSRGGDMERKGCKLFENYIRRLKALESHFPRLETSDSAVDIRTECHELEKHAMIIRFTRFHECEEKDGAGWLIRTANSEVFQSSFHPAGSEVLPQKLIADCAMLMKLLEGFHILSL